MENTSVAPIKEFNKNQKIVAGVFYVVIVIASLASLAGAIWTLADVFIGPTGKLQLFNKLNLGYKIAIIGGFLAGLFFLLVFFSGLFKKSSRSLIGFIYKKRELEERYKNRKGVKIAAGGLLVSVIGIIIGLILAIIWDMLAGPRGSFSDITFLSSTGPWVLITGIGLFLLVGSALFMIYFWKNGYFVILKIMGALEKEE
ncbi:hypothetical protein LCGC14_0601680 [marine sediment metagenome]|uniref:Uncharacterized protein n=1 Tax=marine sediment metagenome TaxID=412755 RepID=A0A0F9RF60_9ZZZZ|nr:MAG: hypothetical protein Lokiarch_20750 [Candidatus Lokiarchaeum sp. GC14_75]